MVVIVVLEGFVILLLVVLVVGLLRSHAEILRRLHDLGAGAYEEDGASSSSGAGTTSPVEFTPAPGVPEPRGSETPAFDLSGVSPTGTALAVGVRGTEQSTLIAFLSSGCLTCRGFWDAFAREDLTTLPGQNTRLVVVTKGSEHESPSEVAELAPPQLTTLMSDQAWWDYEVPVSPYFILVDGPSSSVIGEGAAASWTQVHNLLEQACADIGLTTEGTPVTRASGRMSGPEREARVDTELRAAGIEPGHPELYQTTLASDPTEQSEVS